MTMITGTLSNSAMLGSIILALEEIITDNTKCRLVVDETTVSPNTPLSSYTAADYPGYAEPVVTVLGTPDMESGYVRVAFSSCFFQATGVPAAPQNVTGWIIYDGTQIIAAGTLSSPSLISAEGDMLSFSPVVHSP
jgi:hypothetical protein